MKAFAIGTLLLLLAGCGASMPNHITPATSKFDGSKSLIMEPGFVYESTDSFAFGYFQLGLLWSSKYDDAILIKAKLTSGITRIKSHEGLQFVIDGETIKLSSVEIATNFEITTAGYNVNSNSFKNFRTNKAFINKLIQANSVKIKLITNKGYVEGDFKSDKPSAAIRGFKDFMQQIKTS